MQRFQNRRPSPALVISIVALLVAMGGTGYAAFKLPKNSVGSKQIKSNAVTSSKVKNRSLLSADFKAGQIPAGAPGPKGDPGAKGDTGNTGAAGSAFAFAHVNSDGTLDTANSSGVTASSSTVMGVYCLTLNDTPRNAVASGDRNQGGVVIAMTNLQPGPAARTAGFPRARRPGCFRTGPPRCP